MLVEEKGCMKSPYLLLLTVASVHRSGSACPKYPQRWPKAPVNPPACTCPSRCPGKAHQAFGDLPAETGDSAFLPGPHSQDKLHSYK